MSTSPPRELVERALEPLHAQLGGVIREQTIERLARDVLTAVTVEDPIAAEVDGVLRIVWPDDTRGWVIVSADVLDGLVEEINKLRAQLRDAAALAAAREQREGTP